MKKTLLILGLSLMTLLSACSVFQEDEIGGENSEYKESELNEERLGEYYYVAGSNDCSPEGTYPEFYTETWRDYAFSLPYCWSVEEVATDMLYFYSTGSEEEILFIGPGELEEESTSSYESGSITVAGESWKFYTDDPNTTKVSTIISSFVNMNPSEEFEEPEYEIPEELLEDKVSRPTDDETIENGDLTLQFEGIEFLLTEDLSQCLSYSTLSLWKGQIEGYEINEDQRLWDCAQYRSDFPSNQFPYIRLQMFTSKHDIYDFNEQTQIANEDFLEYDWGTATALTTRTYSHVDPEEFPDAFNFENFDILIEFNELDTYLLLQGSIDQNSMSSYEDAISLIKTISIQ